MILFITLEGVGSVVVEKDLDVCYKGVIFVIITNK